MQLIEQKNFLILASKEGQITVYDCKPANERMTAQISSFKTAAC